MDKLRGVKGALPITQKAKKEGFKEIFLPLNAEESGKYFWHTSTVQKTLLQVFLHINTKRT